ncbi:hypothetical protein Lal_00046699 [Lupinus albus]|nr:hypothetical protein Lal_00046699 [Lupinus albus]
MEYQKVCFGAENDLWYLDSGCSRHMTGDKSKFSFILPKDGFVTYGDNNKGKILGIGRIGKPPHDLCTIEDRRLIGLNFSEKEPFFKIRKELGILVENN